jgi:glycosyltransferase involved in cell wall biosynthesis
VVHAHSPFVTGVLAARAARRAHVPLVYTYHTRLDQYAHYVPFERGLTRRAANAAARAFADRAAIVVVPTRAMEVRLREIGVGAPIRVVPSAIDTARFAAGRRSDAVRARLGAATADRLVLLVSRLGREKNVGLAIEALARIADPRVRLALVGDGPSRSVLEARARELGVAARVAFAGASDPADLPDIYASADAFAFPSLSETQGLVLAEAMAAGLPIAAVATPVTREVLGGVGRVSRGDPERFARAVLAALDAGRDQSAEHLALERFNLRTHAERMAAIYAEARERFD